MGTRRSHHIELTCEYENVTPDATLPHILDKKRLERIACASNAAKKKFSMFCDGNVLASKIYWVHAAKHRIVIFMNQTVGTCNNLIVWSNFICRWLWIIIEILTSARLTQTAAQ